jgi:hypothetical protein
MKKVIIFYAFLLILCKFQLYAQAIPDSSIQTKINYYYKLGLQYKATKDEADFNYKNAYSCFSKAAELGDDQSIYAIAYMHYKGLGCEQDYSKAAKLFADGSAKNRDNSLYFYGLCWRNGYGVIRNSDSAKYYLQKSADLGYKLAQIELDNPTAENSNDSAAQVLLQQISNAAVPNKNVLNQFNKIQPHLPSSEIITGEYTGWLIQYDWSGKHIVTTKRMQLNLNAKNLDISGEWIEEGTDTAKIYAQINSDNLQFKETQYSRTDHYSFNKAITYNFHNAKLNVVQLGDSVFLAGNVEMFSTLRGEPSKPIFVALSRAGLKEMDSIMFSKVKLIAYPNPFANTLNAEFNLPRSAKVSVQLISLNGTILYSKEAGELEKGFYSLPIHIINLTQGIYLLKLNYNNHTKTIKVIKQ